MQTRTIVGMVIATMMGTAMQAEAFPGSFDDAVAHSRVMNAGYLTETSRRYVALPPESRKLLTHRLEALAGMPVTTDGVRGALRLLHQQVESFPQGDAPYEGSGRPPGQQAMLSAGMCMVHGLVAQVADAARNTRHDAAALLQLIQREPTLSERDRGLLLRELQQSFGDELYAQVSKDAALEKGSK